MKRLFYLIIFVISIFTINVCATNDVSYNITITKDYDFKEVINYSLTDYKKITNGYNYFNTIVFDDIYTDIFYNTKYKKIKSKSGSAYKVKLSHTYNEYTMSNANFLNNCFEKSSYDYDIDKISFTSENGFLCFRGDSLRITLKTDFTVTNTNAIKNGNTYTWNPNSEDFEMYFTLYKTYPESVPKDNDDAGIVHDDGSKGEENGEPASKKDNEEKKEVSFTGVFVTIMILVIVVIVLFIIFKNLKNKKNNLNEI